MTDLLRPLVDRVSDLYRSVEGMVTLRWGTVTATSPLAVRLDGEADPLGIVPASLVPVLLPGERVLCASQHRRVTVLCVAGRVAPLRGTTAQRLALGLSGVVEPGQTFFDEDENREYVWDGVGWKRGVYVGKDTDDPVDLMPYMLSGVTGEVIGEVRGGIADISGSIEGISVPSGSTPPFLSNAIPTNFRPIRNKWGDVWGNGFAGGVLVRSDGRMALSNRTGTNFATSTPIQFTVTYIVA